MSNCSEKEGDIHNTMFSVRINCTMDRNVCRPGEVYSLDVLAKFPFVTAEKQCVQNAKNWCSSAGCSLISEVLVYPLREVVESGF